MDLNIGNVVTQVNVKDGTETALMEAVKEPYIVAVGYSEPYSRVVSTAAR